MQSVTLDRRKTLTDGSKDVIMMGDCLWRVQMGVVRKENTWGGRMMLIVNNKNQKKRGRSTRQEGNVGGIIHDSLRRYSGHVEFMILHVDIMIMCNWNTILL